LAFVRSDDAILIDTENALGDGLSWIENCRVRVTGKPPLQSGQFALGNLAVTDHALAKTKKLRDKTLGHAGAIESFGGLGVVVEIVHWEVKVHTVVTPPAFSSIPSTANASLAVGVGGRRSGPPEAVPILTRVLSTEVADSQPLDVNTHRHRIVGIVIFKHEAGFNTPILTLVGTRAADRLKGLLIVRFANDRQRERAGTLQVGSHALRRGIRW
jgi:hypothetical protein